MVLVTMGHYDPNHLVSAFFHVFKIRDDIVNADHVTIREHHPGVHDQDLVVIFIDGHILPDFTQSTQGDYL